MRLRRKETVMKNQLDRDIEVFGLKQEVELLGVFHQTHSILDWTEKPTKSGNTTYRVHSKDRTTGHVVLLLYDLARKPKMALRLKEVVIHDFMNECLADAIPVGTLY